MRHLTLTSAEASELAEGVLARGGEISFRAQGSSMRPFLKDGDFLTVIGSRRPLLGDIILYRVGEGGLAAHRLVGWGKKNNQRTIIARGDCPGSAKEKVQASQVIGVVAAARRGDTSRDLQRIWWRSAGILWSLSPSLLRSCLCPVIAARRQVSSPLARLRSIPQFRRLMRLLLGRYIRYGEVRPERDHPFRGRMATIGREHKLTPKETELAARNRLIVAVLGRRVVGRLYLCHFPEPVGLYAGWWIFSMEVRPLFRGAGLGECLVRTALELARGLGAAKVCLLVNRQNNPAIQAYRKLGFVLETYPALESTLVEEASRGIPRRQLMVRYL